METVENLLTNQHWNNLIQCRGKLLDSFRREGFPSGNEEVKKELEMFWRILDGFSQFIQGHLTTCPANENATKATNRTLVSQKSCIQVKQEPSDEPEEIIPNTQTIVFPSNGIPTGQIPSSSNSDEHVPEPYSSESVTAVVPAKPAEMFQTCIICQEPVACRSMTSIKYQEHVDNCCEKNARIEFHEELFSNNNDIIGTDSQMVRRSSRRTKTEPIGDEKVSEKKASKSKPRKRKVDSVRRKGISSVNVTVPNPAIPHLPPVEVLRRNDHVINVPSSPRPMDFPVSKQAKRKRTPSRQATPIPSLEVVPFPDASPGPSPIVDSSMNSSILDCIDSPIRRPLKKRIKREPRSFDSDIDFSDVEEPDDEIDDESSDEFEDVRYD